MRKIIVFSLLSVSAGASSAAAQCAMCRATLENNISNGNVGIAAGINFGIVYLFCSPYALVLLLTFFWHRAGKRNVNSTLESN